MPRLTEKQVAKFTSDFQIIADYFVQLNEKNDYTPNKKIIRHTDSFLKLMTVLTKDEKYINIQNELSDNEEGVNMYSVLDKAEARGEARGISIGAMNKTLDILRLIIAKNNWSKQQAMDFIGIPESEFAKYAALI